ncbi:MULTISPECIES: hypothetical protein [unclassified Cryobacterium]|uniref:hypothetical protein n=1 Tax=unclassified Cryobacterium TaxID=2649013 RepID=UPI001446F00D|nr:MULTISPECIES: hypothetical protein [unclassified Cryobacterium]
MGYFVIALGVIILISNITTLTRSPRPTHINGLRRRKDSESDAAWEAGLKLYLPFSIAVGIIGIVGGAVGLFMGEREFVVLGITLVLMILVAIVGAVLFDRRVKREARREAGGGS